MRIMDCGQENINKLHNIAELSYDNKCTLPLATINVAAQREAVEIQSLFPHNIVDPT